MAAFGCWLKGVRILSLESRRERALEQPSSEVELRAAIAAQTRLMFAVMVPRSPEEKAIRDEHRANIERFEAQLKALEADKANGATA